MGQRILQTNVYIKKFLRIQMYDFAKFIMFGAIIAFFVVFVTGDDMFVTYESTKSGFFSIVSACIWIGIFNSIQIICREKRNIVKDELDKGLFASSYISAHFVSQAILCAIQSLLVVIICWIKIDFPEDGLLFGGSFIEYLITIFLITYSADALALVISALTPNPITAMTVMPFLLILQLLMSGVLFELSGLSDTIANLTISKWGMHAVGSIGNLNSTDLPSKLTISYPAMNFPPRAAEDIYEATSSHILRIWSIFVLFIVVSYIFSIISLKLTTRRLAK